MGVIITQSLAHELAPWNITVNAFCPGIIESEMWDYATASGAKSCLQHRAEALR